MNLRSSIAFLPLVLTGCLASVGNIPMANQSQVHLRENNFTVAQTNVSGEASCPYLFGFIPLGKPSIATSAMDDLVKASGSDGKSRGLINLSMDRTTINFVLFTLRMVKVRADVVEFQ